MGRKTTIAKVLLVMSGGPPMVSMAMAYLIAKGTIGMALGVTKKTLGVAGNILGAVGNVSNSKPKKRKRKR